MWMYNNGNVKVILFDDGTKYVIYEDDVPCREFPESMDIKITGYCDNNCQFCYEQSDVDGRHADLSFLLSMFDGLPAGIELALGGGNPLAHPELEWFLQRCKERGLVTNITINKNHIQKYFDLIEKLIKHKLVYGVGISVVDFIDIDNVKKICALTNNVVIHTIAGVVDYEFIKKLYDITKNKTLILGYKYKGNGQKYFSEIVTKNIESIKVNLSNLINTMPIAFDNLAIVQLDVQNQISKEMWDTYYMGDDGEHSMYIDAVEKMFALSSIVEEKIDIGDKNVIECFKYLRNKKF